MKRYIYLLLLIIALACNRPAAEPGKASETDSTAVSRGHYIGTGKLIPIDYSTGHYHDIPADTITPSGWHINYLVKDDSTHYDDLYVQWSKGDIIGIYKCEDVLTYRSYFIPTYKGELKNHILFWHGCATDCQAILVCDKDSTQARDIPHVTDYNVNLGQIVYIDEKQFGVDENVELTILDLMRGEEHKTLFKGIPSLNRQMNIDTVIFSKNKITIEASLRKTYKDTIDTKAINTINLK